MQSLVVRRLLTIIQMKTLAARRRYTMPYSTRQAFLSGTHSTTTYTSRIWSCDYCGWWMNPHNYVSFQTLQSSPGSKYIYSDLSMITLMHVVGTLARSAVMGHSYLTLPAAAQVASCMICFATYIHVLVLLPLFCMFIHNYTYTLLNLAYRFLHVYM